MSRVCPIIQARLFSSLSKSRPAVLRKIEIIAGINHPNCTIFKGATHPKLLVCETAHFSKYIMNNDLAANGSIVVADSKELCFTNKQNDRDRSNNLKRKKRNGLGWILAGCCFSKKKNKTVADVGESSPLLPDLQTTDETRAIADVSVERPVCLLETAKAPSVTLKDIDYLVDCQAGVSGEASTGTKGQPEIKPERPNHFVAIQVDCPEVHNALGLVQDSILGRKPTMKSALNSLPTLHITLIVMNISDDKDLQRAREALTESYHKVKEDVLKNRLVLQFEGLSSFKKKVLYADVKKGEDYERLQDLYENVVTTYEAYGFDVRERHYWTPHLTVAKLSKTNYRNRNKKTIKSIDPLWYESHQNAVFGCQTVNSLQLLSMTEEKDSLGYYQRKHECIFAVPEGETNPNSQNNKEVREKIRQLTSDAMKTLKE